MTEQGLLEYLAYNKRVTSKEIEAHFDVPGAEVRRRVKQLRREGYPICSGKTGYWIGGQKEIEHTIAQLKSRGTDMLATASAMERMAISGQLEIL